LNLWWRDTPEGVLEPGGISYPPPGQGGELQSQLVQFEEMFWDG